MENRQRSQTFTASVQHSVTRSNNTAIDLKFKKTRAVTFAGKLEQGTGSGRTKPLGTSTSTRHITRQQHPTATAVYNEELPGAADRRRWLSPEFSDIPGGVVRGRGRSSTAESVVIAANSSGSMERNVMRTYTRILAFFVLCYVVPMNLLAYILYLYPGRYDSS